MPDFGKIKARILGTWYDLSYSTIGPMAMRTLNRRYRRKNAATDILSFPLDPASGEIVMCLSEVRKHAHEFGMSPTAYRAFLFIHGCLHLKGHRHGRIMEQLEDRYCCAFGIPLPERSWHHQPRSASTSARTKSE